MKLSILSLAAAAAAAVAIASPALAHTVVYTATLSGLAESPPTASLGTGSVTVSVNDETFQMRIEAQFTGLTGNTTIAHIHCCTAAAGAGTAGVAVHQGTLIGFPAGVTSGSYDHTFDMGLASSWGTGFLGANGNSTATAFSSLLTGMNDGKAYFNIHSTSVGSGEIRGFLALAPVPEPETYALMLAGLAIVGWAARRRQQA
jgi:CHRD domain/PEP-CTERM motif